MRRVRKRPPAGAYRNVVAAYDGSEGAKAALARAAELAADGRASLTLVQATSEDGGPVPARHPPDREAAAEARHSLEQAIEGLDQELQASPWVVGGPAAKSIIAVAEEIGADLIVTGSRGLGRVQTAVLGSVSGTLVREAPCDVLVVRPRR